MVTYYHINCPKFSIKITVKQTLNLTCQVLYEDFVKKNPKSFVATEKKTTFVVSKVLF